MRRDEAYLLDMLLAARDAQNCMRGLTHHQFGESRLHQLAALKALETIGEAATRVSEPFRVAYPEIPWREIIGMRNRLVHAYFEIDLDQVWDTVQNDLPPLIDILERLVPPEEA